MRAIFFVLTAPVWLPTLFVAASASLAIGITMTVMLHALKDKPARDNWRELD